MRTYQAGHKWKPLILHFGSPVQNYRQRCGVRLDDLGVDQKFLAGGGDIVGNQVQGGNGLPSVRLEQSRGGTGFEGRVRSYRNRSHSTVGRNVEQFLFIPPPSRLPTSSSGDLPFAISGRKRGDVDFRISRLIRCVCQPLSALRGNRACSGNYAVCSVSAALDTGLIVVSAVSTPR